MSGDVPSNSSAHGSPSTDGASSPHGTPRDTPGTKVTEFSPDEYRPELKDGTQDGHKVTQPPTFALKGVSSMTSPRGKLAEVIASQEHDPFTTPTVFETAEAITSEDGTALAVITKAAITKVGHVGAGAIPRLSPTAATFLPQGRFFGEGAASSRSGLSLSRIQILNNSVPTAVSATVGYLNATSVPDVQVHSDSQNRCPMGISAGFEPFTNEIPTSRYLKLSDVPNSASYQELVTLLNSPIFGNAKTCITSKVASEGVILIRYDDLRHARAAATGVPKYLPHLRVDFISNKQFTAYCNAGDPLLVSDYEGQLLVTAVWDGGSHRAFEDGYTAWLLCAHLLETGGQDQVKNVETFVQSFPLLILRVEFFDVKVAESVVPLLDGKVFNGIPMSLSKYAPDTPTGTVQRGPVIIGHEDRDREALTGGLAMQGIATRDTFSMPMARLSVQQTPLPAYSPGLPPPYVPYDLQIAAPVLLDVPGVPGLAVSPYGAGVVGQERGHLAAGGSRNGPLIHRQRGMPRVSNRTNNRSSSHHNVVDIGRIQQGLDVRTTIMLRNIPNKVTALDLKNLLDETSHGKFDFVYLRIDFANNCNVGYAFINFEDPYHIIDFVRARAGVRWARFNSDKVAEISYATIQGKDCLVQKFRNSSVMLEHPNFRPKIFTTGIGPEAGLEEQFPGPDNPSKMRRSVENAEHVGLFAPRAGQHFRDEQRRRRSQYDRGTRLAEMDEILEDGPAGHRGTMFDNVFINASGHFPCYGNSSFRGY